MLREVETGSRRSLLRTLMGGMTQSCLVSDVLNIGRHHRCHKFALHLFPPLSRGYCLLLCTSTRGMPQTSAQAPMHVHMHAHIVAPTRAPANSHTYACAPQETAKTATKKVKAATGME